MKNDVLNEVLDEIKNFLEPVIASAQYETSRSQLLSRLGLDWGDLDGAAQGDLKSKLEAVASSYQLIEDLLNNPPSTLWEFTNSAKTLGQTFKSVDDIFLSSDITIGLTEANAKALAKNLIAILVVDYLRSRYPQLYTSLVALTVVEPNDSDLRFVPLKRTSESADMFGNVFPPEFTPSKLISLLTNPLTTLEDSYFGENGIQTIESSQYVTDKLFPRLGEFLVSLGGNYRYGWAAHHGVELGSVGNSLAKGMLYVEYPVQNFEDGKPSQSNSSTNDADRDDSASHDSTFGAILGLSGPEQGNLGLVVSPFGKITLESTIGNWVVALEASAQLDGFTIGPEWFTFPKGSQLADLSLNLQAVKIAQDEDVAFRVGPMSGTHLEIGSLSVRSFFEASPKFQDLGIELNIHRGLFQIDPGQGDGFLKKVIPANGIHANFDIGIGWSRQKNLFFSGSGGLEVTIPVNASILGVIEVNSLYLVIGVTEGNVFLSIATSATLKLGPVTAVVDRIGLNTELSFPESGGNLGPVNVDIGFRAPSGLGLSISAGGITGGGFLDFKENEYAGALQLRFEKLGLSAVGFITTGGPQGFSMVINIGVLFSPPVQLSFGFQLSGVGGLIAIKRTMSTNALQAGVADGSLESLMFPSDPVGDAPALISQLKNILPPEDGRYVVGPMLRLTWGAKSLIKADLGIFLELPSPLRIFLVGQLEGTFPHEDQALIHVKVGILGLLDFGKKVLSIDARLYDSRILVYELSGDMALRLSWGNDPYFIISMGGFHPRYAIPSVCPPFLSPMRRLRLELGSGSVFNLSCESYLALSTNTLQFGARAELYVKAGPAKVEGYLGFDTLIIFSPFSFEVDIQAGVRVKVKGRNVAGVSLAFTLSGPTPWRARGKAKIKILFFKFKVRFNKSWGRSDQVRIPGKDPLPDLLQVLAQRQSWGTVMPIGRLTMESLKPLTTVPTTAQGDPANSSPPNLPLVVHPQGTLEFRQSILPLGLRIKFYENAPVSGHDAFDITKVVVGGQTFLPKENVPNNAASSSFSFSPVQEFFARCQFLSCSKQEKLSAPSFEKLDAGVALNSQAIQIPPHNSPNRKENYVEKSSLDYESSVIDEDRMTIRQAQWGRPISLGNKLLIRGNSARRSGYRRDPLLRYQKPLPVTPVTLRQEPFRIVGSGTLKPISAKELRTLRFRKSGEMTRAEADEVLAEFEKAHPQKKGAYQIVSAFEAGI